MQATSSLKFKGKPVRNLSESLSSAIRTLEACLKSNGIALELIVYQHTTLKPLAFAQCY